MPARPMLLLAALLGLSLAGEAAACLWDRETLAEERARFPTALEMIVGHFPRHSDAYYQWRLEQWAADEARTPAAYDDVAVALDKLGRHDEAVELIREKIARFPETGRYESEANLGTFLIHAGRLREGVRHIDAALAINPNAHFGREIVQKRLAQYLINDRSVNGERVSFAVFLEGRPAMIDGERDPIAELNLAAKGLMGMLRFGHADSPILLEALGDVLMAGNMAHIDYEGAMEYDAKRLATRAYLRAASGLDGGEAERLTKKADGVVSMMQSVELADIRASLAREVAEAEAYVDGIVASEAAWRAAGNDMDAMFDAAYREQPTTSQPLGDRISDATAKARPVMMILIGLGIVATVLGAFVWGAWRLLRVAARSAGERGA